MYIKFNSTSNEPGIFPLVAKSHNLSRDVSLKPVDSAMGERHDAGLHLQVPSVAIRSVSSVSSMSRNTRAVYNRRSEGKALVARQRLHMSALATLNTSSNTGTPTYTIGSRKITTALLSVYLDTIHPM